MKRKVEQVDKIEPRTKAKLGTGQAGRKSKFTVPVAGGDGAKKGGVTLPKEIFGISGGEVTLASYIRVFRSNQRKARARVKTRASVNRTKAKIYRQKGTGKARHGARSAPIYVGGGVAHGPTGKENYKLSLPKILRKRALSTALSLKFKGGDLSVADIDEITPKTKRAWLFLKGVGMREATIVHGGSKNLVRAARNLSGVNMIDGKTVSAYDVFFPKKVILTKEGLAQLTKRFLREIA